jgi:hypothetical protein
MRFPNRGPVGSFRTVHRVVRLLRQLNPREIPLPSREPIICCTRRISTLAANLKSEVLECLRTCRLFLATYGIPFAASAHASQVNTGAEKQFHSSDPDFRRSEPAQR